MTFLQYHHHQKKEKIMTDRELSKAIKGITPKLVRSLSQGEHYNHNMTHHLYSYTTESIELEDGESYVVLKDNKTDDEIAVLLLNEDKISYQMLI